MRRVVTTAAMVAALAGVCAVPVAGQLVVGTVTEAGSTRPVAGAMVRLAGEHGHTGSRYLTGADGRYRLSLPGPGSYMLEVSRIGFGETRVGPVTAEGGTLTFDIAVRAAPVRLEGLAVETGRRQCALAQGDGSELQAVWDEARKALAAASWTEDQGGYRFRIQRTVRLLDPSGARVEDEERGEVEREGGNSVRTLPARELAEGGYVQERDSHLYYYGPDAAVLLSDAFLETHCFTLLEGPPEAAHLLGVGFEPVDGRRTSDISGVLWMDGATLRLERVEFGYTGIDRVVGHELARGEVRFLELADGRWVVRDWYIRAPVLELRVGVGAGGRRVDRAVVRGLQEYGSEVVTVESPDGERWTADRPAGQVRGVVFDSIRSQALAGAEVRLAGRGFRTFADGAGRWELKGVPPGRYRIHFGHPSLDSLGVTPDGADVEVEPDGVHEVLLAVPPLSRLLARACGDDPGGVVVGFVRDDGGAPLAGVEVGLAEEGDAGPVTVTDEDGAYTLCGLPDARDLRVEARAGPVRSVGGDVRTRRGAAVRVDLRMGASQNAVLTAGEAPLPRFIQGRVVDESAKGVADAVVAWRDDAGGEGAAARSNANGDFFLVGPPKGPVRLRVTHPDRGDLESELALQGAVTRVVARLAGAKGEGLAGWSDPPPMYLEEVGFTVRERAGGGMFLDAHALEALPSRSYADLFALLPDMDLLRDSDLPEAPPLHVFRRARLVWGACPPAVYLDGVRARDVGRRHGPALEEVLPFRGLGALELYPVPAAAPAPFDGAAARCGAVVLWSRGR